MKQFSAIVTGNALIGSDFFEMTLSWDRSAGIPLPGQFFTIRAAGESVPLLRRPFAFSAFDEEHGIAMLYQKRGRGTAIIGAKTAGETLDVLGPLGRPFPLPAEGKRAILVAGGIGIGPIAFLGATCARKQVPATLVIGCRSASLLPATLRLSALSPVICTDDGSLGFRGTTGDYLASILPSIDRAAVIYACGPMPMLRVCHEIAVARGIDCFVSVEQIMACGVGACMGCVVRAAGGGYLRACTEGPVFASRELDWDLQKQVRS
jgi:dihydroorotate dehydrogenase electron transfer subunit